MPDTDDVSPLGEPDPQPVPDAGRPPLPPATRRALRLLGLAAALVGLLALGVHLHGLRDTESTPLGQAPGPGFQNTPSSLSPSASVTPEAGASPTTGQSPPATPPAVPDPTAGSAAGGAQPGGGGAGGAAAGGAPAGQPPGGPNTAPGASLVLDNFDSPPAWSRLVNDLGRYTGADSFANGGGNGDGVVAAGELTLAYDDDGWFGSEVANDVSRYTYLVLRMRGGKGGEERHFRLALGGVERLFADYTTSTGGHPTVTPSYQDIRIPLASNGINARTPGELSMSFWLGGTSSVILDEIRFE